MTKTKLMKELQEYAGKARDLLGEVQKVIRTRPRLKTLGGEILQSLDQCKKRYELYSHEVEDLPGDSEFAKEQMQIHVTKVLAVLDSYDAQVLLQTVGQSSRQTQYALRLRAGGMKVTDLEDIVDAHKQAVSDYFGLEKVNIPVELIDVEDKGFYEDLARKHKTDLDKLASWFFGTKVQTRMNVDVKEREPHNGFGWANIGYTPTVSKLVAMIAHEGPLGHQTHQTFSQRYDFDHRLYALTTEGLAILGESIALGKMFRDVENGDALVEFERVSRRINDTLPAGIVHLTQHEGKTLGEAAKMLATEFYDENFIIDSYTSYIQKIQDPRIPAYYVGARKIGPLHDQVAEVIFRDKLTDVAGKNARYSQFLNLLYTGNRTPEVMSLEVDLFLKQNRLARE